MSGSARRRDKVDLQLRGVPSALRRRLGEKAARKGVSMSRLVIDLLETHLDRPATIDEWLGELDADGPGRPVGVAPSATLREIRDELDRA